MSGTSEVASAGVSRFSLRDLVSGLVVFLVALPLCLGIALASDAPLFSGIMSGILGGILVGLLSGSHTSVSGPAAGLTAVIAAQIATLGSFQGLLCAIFLAGLLQVVMGVARAGFIAAFFPSSVIKGLLAAIGAILILKQTPHLFGHDPDPIGEMGFRQTDGQNTISELLSTVFDIQPGAAVIGLTSLLMLLLWDRIKVLKHSGMPVPLLVVLFGAGLNSLWQYSGSSWTISSSHLVQVPVAESFQAAVSLLTFPDWSFLSKPATYTAAITFAIVATLETLLNLEAVDRIDPEGRISPPNRELVAQGVGNMAAGLCGGLPMTSVIVRSSVNINARNSSRYSAVFHGFLLCGSVLLMPQLLNQIPLACLAAILITTGLKLASPKLVKQMWEEGRRQFLPFASTVIAIVAIDLLKGVVIGLIISVFFILHSNFRRPLSRTVEKHAAGNVTRIELANQVSFFSRATFERAFAEVPAGGHVLIDARNSVYIDPDILDIIHDFRTSSAPARGIALSFLGLKDHYAELEDHIQYVEHSSPALQKALTSSDVLTLLQEGNERFRCGKQLTRDYRRQVSATALGQAPLAVVLSCMDSRAPIEIVFDLGIGDAFSVRVAGNVIAPRILGSLEYGCAVAGAKLLLVLGHTACGAVTSAVNLHNDHTTAADATGCTHIDSVLEELNGAIHQCTMPQPTRADGESFQTYVDAVARSNVLRSMAAIRSRSSALDAMIDSGALLLMGGVYDVRSGEVELFDQTGTTCGWNEALKASA
ncbi:MAG TPA: SulP family inorganic anion transporter [Polyangiales bacterium]|nr:SulP family inorganic anion transporter [Polyangiales bacterium]